MNCKLEIPNPPKTINGLSKMEMSASLGEKKMQKAQEMIRPSKASIRTPVTYVVSPLTALMFSVNMFERIPGAFCLSSNHPIFFLRIASKSMTLTV